MAHAALHEFAEHQCRRVPKSISQRLPAEAAAVDAALEIKDVVCQKAIDLVDEQNTTYRHNLNMVNLRRMNGIMIVNAEHATLRASALSLDAARDVLSEVSLAANKVVKVRRDKYEATLSELERIVASRSLLPWQPGNRNRLGRTALRGKRRLAA